jgi:hypothetical protein
MAYDISHPSTGQVADGTGKVGNCLRHVTPATVAAIVPRSDRTILRCLAPNQSPLSQRPGSAIRTLWWPLCVGSKSAAENRRLGHAVGRITEATWFLHSIYPAERAFSVVGQSET